MNLFGLKIFNKKEPEKAVNAGYSSSENKKTGNLSGMAVSKSHEKDPLSTLGNPTMYINPAVASTYLEQADKGNYTMAQWLLRYALQLDGDLLCVSERIDRAIQTIPWSIKPIEGADPKLAEEQVNYLKSEYEKIDNLESIIRFLSSHRLAGYAHAFISMGKDNTIILTPMDQWWFVRDGLYGDWGYNPSAQRCGYQMGMGIDEKNCLIVESNRPILKYAIKKYLASSYNEKWWDKYNEIVSRQGTVIIAPERVEDADAFNLAAIGIAEGNSGWLPNGTTINSPNTDRTLQPYADRLTFLREQLVLAITGGLLTSLAAPTGLGSGVANVQQDVWQVISAGIALDIAQEFRKKIDKMLLNEKYPGQKVSAYFTLEYNSDKSENPIATKQDEKIVEKAIEKIDKTPTA